jgi:MoaD family protein
MVAVTVRTFGHLASVMGSHQVPVDLRGTTVDGLLEELTSRFGDPVSSFLYPQGGHLSEMLFVLVNGKNIANLDGTATPLKDGDVVSILPITAGG